MKFFELAKYLQKLEDTSSRIEITKILAELYREVSTDEINQTVNLLLGQLAPSFASEVFNVADKMMVKSISQAFDVDQKDVIGKYKRLGDLGLVSSELAQTNKQKSELNTHTIGQVYKDLRSIAEFQGDGSQEMKVDGVAKLLASSDTLSAKFITRIPIGKLRLGFSDRTIIDALSWMEKGDKSASKQITHAYEVMPDPGKLAEMIKAQGIEKTVGEIQPIVGVPVSPMLAQRLKSPDEMIEKMGEVVVEPKYDGLRVLIHFKRGKFIKSFTRNLNETSWMFPELNEIGDALKCDEAILDSEAVGLHETTKKMANFQDTMSRRRKHNIDEYRGKVSIQFFVFDILYVDGNNLMSESLKQRRRILETTLHSTKVFKIIDQIITKDPNVIRSNHKKLLEKGLEGVIVKRADSQYVPGRTGWRWVKMKEVEEADGKLADTLDCLIMGYTQGKGKRAGFGLGQFLAGVVDGEQIKTITKVGTGLTDEQLESLADRLAKIRINKKPQNYIVDKSLEPDFWVNPQVIVELAADEITKSPNHSSGYALRFPRLIRFRDDKDTTNSTSINEVIQLYKLQ